MPIVKLEHTLEPDQYWAKHRLQNNFYHRFVLHTHLMVYDHLSETYLYLVDWCPISKMVWMDNTPNKDKETAKFSASLHHINNTENIT